MAYPKKLVFQTVRTVAMGALTANFQNLGTAFTLPVRLYKFVNDTNSLIQLSTDGTNVHDVYAAGSGGVFDFTTNKVRDEGAFIAQGIQMQVRYLGAAPTTGSGVYLIVIVGED